MITSELTDENGNRLVSMSETLANASLRIDISRLMLMQMRHGDAILIQPDSRMGAVMRIIRQSDLYQGF